MSRFLVRSPFAPPLALAIAVAVASPAAAGQAAPAPAPVSPQAPPAGAAAAPRVLTLDDALALAEVRNERCDCRGRGEATGDRPGEAPASGCRSSPAPRYDRTLQSEFSGIFDSRRRSDGGRTAASGVAIRPAERSRRLSFSQLVWAGGRVAAPAARPSSGATTRAVARFGQGAALARRGPGVLRVRAGGPPRGDRRRGADAQADRAFEQTRAKRDAGRVSEFELLRAQVDRDTLRTPVVRVRAATRRRLLPPETAARPAARHAGSARRRPRRRPAAAAGALRGEGRRGRGGAVVAPADGGDAGRLRRPGERGRRRHRRRPASARDRVAVELWPGQLHRPCHASTTGARTGRSGWVCRFRS